MVNEKIKLDFEERQEVELLLTQVDDEDVIHRLAGLSVVLPKRIAELEAKHTDIIKQWKEEEEDWKRDEKRLRKVVEVMWPVRLAFASWISSGDCDCPAESHICGITQRREELRALDRALQDAGLRDEKEEANAHYRYELEAQCRHEDMVAEEGG